MGYLAASRWPINHAAKLAATSAAQAIALIPPPAKSLAPFSAERATNLSCSKAICGINISDSALREHELRIHLMFITSHDL
jgi:hypothetical protein